MLKRELNNKIAISTNDYDPSICEKNMIKTMKVGNMDPVEVLDTCIQMATFLFIVIVPSCINKSKFGL